MHSFHLNFFDFSLIFQAGCLVAREPTLQVQTANKLTGVRGMVFTHVSVLCELISDER